ncbi:hypothetical protein [Pantoea sp. paga]|uniref:hypothetical protein n=1 Tax=Pantoea sp. paga TaxID=2597519 RepID=UPI00164336AF|nr:hypothetical protein [Pantoea sp. paga]
MKTLIAVLMLAAFGASAAEVTCRIDVNNDKVCSDGTKTRTNVWGDEVTTDK